MYIRQGLQFYSVLKIPDLQNVWYDSVKKIIAVDM